MTFTTQAPEKWSGVRQRRLAARVRRPDEIEMEDRKLAASRVERMVKDTIKWREAKTKRGSSYHISP